MQRYLLWCGCAGSSLEVKIETDSNDAMEIKTEADSNDITERLHDGEPSASNFIVHYAGMVIQYTYFFSFDVFTGCYVLILILHLFTNTENVNNQFYVARGILSH